MNPLEVVVAGGVITLISSTIAWLLARRDKKDERTHNSQTPTPPTTQEVWNRLDHVEKVLRAAVGALGELAEQFPDGHEPVISKRHADVLAAEGYLPDSLVSE